MSGRILQPSHEFRFSYEDDVIPRLLAMDQREYGSSRLVQISADVTGWPWSPYRTSDGRYWFLDPINGRWSQGSPYELCMSPVRDRKYSRVSLSSLSYSVLGTDMEYASLAQLKEQQTRTLRITTREGCDVVLNVVGDSEDMRHLGVVLDDCVAAKDIRSATFDWNADPKITRTVSAREYDLRICEWRGR